MLEFFNQKISKFDMRKKLQKQKYYKVFLHCIVSIQNIIELKYEFVKYKAFAVK